MNKQNGTLCTFTKGGILTPTTTGMNLEDVMLSEITQTQKRQILHDSTHMRYLNYSDSYKQEVEWLPGEGGWGVAIKWVLELWSCQDEGIWGCLAQQCVCS